MKRLVMALCSLVLLATPLLAMQPAPQGEFVPVNPQTAQGIEHLPAAPLVMGAYAFVWVALLLYVWSIWRRLARVEHEMNALARRAGEGSRAR
jgi:CcmD family protein